MLALLSTRQSIPAPAYPPIPGITHVIALMPLPVSAAVDLAGAAIEPLVRYR